MALGPGKYDDVCTTVRSRTEARGVIVIVLDGNKGSGMSCQADAQAALMLPALLRQVAKDIDDGNG